MATIVARKGIDMSVESLQNKELIKGYDDGGDGGTKSWVPTWSIEEQVWFVKHIQKTNKPSHPRLYYYQKAKEIAAEKMEALEELLKAEQEVEKIILHHCHICKGLVSTEQGYDTWYFKDYADPQPLCKPCYKHESGILLGHKVGIPHDLKSEPPSLGDATTADPVYTPSDLHPETVANKAVFKKSLSDQSNHVYLKAQGRMYNDNRLHFQVGMKQLNKPYGYSGDICFNASNVVHWLKNQNRTLTSFASGELYFAMQMRLDTNTGKMRVQVARQCAISVFNRNYGLCFTYDPKAVDPLTKYLVAKNKKVQSKKKG